jgi:hypothetical protein
VIGKLRQSARAPVASNLRYYIDASDGVHVVDINRLLTLFYFIVKHAAMLHHDVLAMYVVFFERTTAQAAPLGLCVRVCSCCHT